MLSLQKIDEHSRPDHPFLDEDDDCFYIREYTPRQGPQYSSTNQLIWNLKKPRSQEAEPHYRYKSLAIEQAGDELRQLIREEWIKTATLVPIPGSKAKDDPLYDDRIVRVVKRMARGIRADIRDLITQTESLDCFHEGSRLSPHQLAKHYTLDQSLCHGEPDIVGLVDDILTTGSHFKAAKQLISGQWPSAFVVGIFIARVYRID